MPDNPTVPARSDAQRMDALQKGNRFRVQRAQLKRDLKAGRARIADVLTDPPDYAENAKVVDMLIATPRYGRIKANRILQTCRISPSKTIGGLSGRQREDLVALLTTPATQPRRSHGARTGHVVLASLFNQPHPTPPTADADDAAVLRAVLQGRATTPEIRMRLHAMCLPVNNPDMVLGRLADRGVLSYTRVDGFGLWDLGPRLHQVLSTTTEERSAA